MTQSKEIDSEGVGPRGLRAGSVCSLNGVSRNKHRG